ncbi:MAG TPA: serine hydrolase [Tepidisphaeraceae bacterium]|nr:serine hydrolase [Tepidisphaeraceae bacterium]
MTDFKPVDDVVNQGITEGAYPGAAYAVGHAGEIHINALGRYMYCPDSPETKTNTIWDMASCSKVVGCTTAAMILFDQGKLQLDETVASVLPEFGQSGKDKITVENLLLHNSGLQADLHDVPQYTTAAGFMNGLYSLKLSYPTGSKMIYSDLSMITLGKMIEKITGQTLDVFVKSNVLSPLNMRDSMYNPPADLRERCAPTEDVEPWRTKLRALRHQDFKPVPGCHPDAHLYIQGEVHDPSADVLDGISGNAGLFSTAPDLAIFAQMMLSEGTFWGRRIVKADTIRQWTRRINPDSTRALGWDTKSEHHASAGTKFSMHSYGHTGFTGTTIWIDPANQMFAVLLTNRVHPTSNNNKLTHIRPLFHDAVATAFGI